MTVRAKRIDVPILAACLALVTCVAVAAPIELGRVRWERSFDAGREHARKSGKPIFLLFQEVPGCSTCVGFGETVLSSPLFVDAIENEFVPVAIMNNRGGEDAKVLGQFGEPSWNNPVVRFVDAGGRDLIPRRDRVWTPREIAPRMIEALRTAGRPVPAYLELAARETKLRSSAIATFSMPCFWRGEVCLGGIESVLATRAGWLNGREVVEVRFDPQQMTYRGLLERIRSNRCADGVFPHDRKQQAIARDVFKGTTEPIAGRARDAKASDQKYYLRYSAAAELDLTPMQAARVNSALARGLDPEGWLSPRQARDLRRSLAAKSTNGS